MATRKHSIKVPVNFGSQTDITSATLTTIGTPTIYIPENAASTVTFTSVMLFLTYQDTSTATGTTSFGPVAATIQFAAGVTNTITLAGTVAAAATLENKAGIIGPMDYTTYFNTGFGSAGTTSKALTVQVNITNTGGTGTASRAVYGWFEITYEFSDTEAKRIHTVCIPYESGLSTLTATANTTYCTIPQLTGTGGLLAGYSNPVVRYRWIEIKGTGGDGATTDYNLSFRFDAGGTTALPTREMALNSGTYCTYLVDASANSTTATHTFQLWNSLATRWPNLIVNEWLTYEYDVSGTTTVLNYIEIPIEFESPIGGTTAGSNHVFNRSLLIPEPGTIETLNCAAEINYNTSAAATVQVKSGNQVSYRAYAMSVAVCAGQFSLQHRLDPGSGGGGTFSLQRGENNLLVYLYRSTGAMTNVSGVIRFLYKSGVSSNGVDSHTHTVYSLARQMNFTATGDSTYNDNILIPEANYWLASAGLKYYLWIQSALSVFMVQARLASGEGAGEGWRELYNDQYQSDSVLAYGGWIVRARDEFRRYPNDPDTNRMILETSRVFRTTSTTTARYGINWIVAYHTITHAISGAISSSGGGTVNVALYKKNSANEFELFDHTTRVGDGSYSFTVYDDTPDYYVAAFVSDSLKGLSKQSPPATGFDIDLAGGGGGGGGEFFF